jgi:hypothetical protein
MALLLGAVARRSPSRRRWRRPARSRLIDLHRTQRLVVQLSIATPAGLQLVPAVFEDCEALARLFAGVRLPEPLRPDAALAQGLALLIERARALRGFAAGLWCVRGAHDALMGCALVRPAADWSLRHVAVALADRMQEQRHSVDIVRGLVRELDARLCDEFSASAAAPTFILARSTLAELSLLVQQELHCADGRQRGALRQVRPRAAERSVGIVWDAAGRRKDDR